MWRDISAPEMGRGALFYFKTNKSSPHTHVLVCLVLDCLVWKEEPKEESLDAMLALRGGHKIEI